MKNIFSGLMTITVFLRLCELGRAPIWALVISLIAGACMSRAYELSFEEKKSAPPRKTTRARRTQNINTTTLYHSKRGIVK